MENELSTEVLIFIITLQDLPRAVAAWASVAATMLGYAKK